MLSRGGCNEHPMYRVAGSKATSTQLLHQHGKTTPLMIKVEHVAARGDEAIVMFGSCWSAVYSWMDKGDGIKISCQKEDRMDLEGP